MTFPFFKVIPATQGYEAIAAIKVAALLHSDLLLDSYYAKAEPGKYAAASLLDPRQLHHAREALLSALTSWIDTTLEIRLAVVPDLAFRTQSQINLHFLIRCCAEESDVAKEAVASRFLTLMPLLSAHCPEASCAAVTGADELDQLLGWLQPQHALSVQRRREQISLAHPLANDERPIGFNCGNPLIGTVETGEPVIQHLSPWVPELDDWGRLLDTLTCQIDPLLVILRLRPQQDAKQDLDLLNETLHQCENYLQSHNPDLLANAMLVQALRGQYIRRLVALRGPSYSVGVFLLSSTVIPPAFAQVLGAAITHLPQGNNDDHFFRGGFELQNVDAAAALDHQFFADEAAFSLAEAACAFRFPSPPCREIAGLPVKRFRTALAKLSLHQSQPKEAPLRLFVNEHMGVTQPVTMNSDDRMRHTFIVGQTGCGKSSLMEAMINQDIAAGRGVAVIDPHGDMIDNILQRIPHKRGGDVILFDFLDLERPIGFNLIAWRTLMERDLIIDEFYRVLDHIYDMKVTGGPVFEQYFRNMLRLLMGSEPRKDFIPTILDFLQAFIDKNFRDWLLEHSRDKGAKDFLTEVERVGGDAKWDNVSPYITSKFSRFVNDTTLRRIIGQERSALDFDDIINNGKILLVKLGKGRFGSQVSALLANMMILRFKLAAMKRGDMPMEKRRDFFLYVDEAHNLPQENFTEMLAEVRKYRMGLILATQYCTQLASSNGHGDNLLSAVFGNVGSMVIFRTGSQDAEELAKGLRPYFTDLDITSLPNFAGYARMNLGPDVTPPFSFRTELDPTLLNPKLGERIRSYSRLKYGLPADYVEDQIDEHDESWKKIRREAPPAWLLDQKGDGDRLLADLDLSLRTIHLLQQSGYKTVRDIATLSLDEVIDKTGLGRVGINEIKERLNRLGVQMKQDAPGVKPAIPWLPENEFDGETADGRTFVVRSDQRMAVGLLESADTPFNDAESIQIGDASERGELFALFTSEGFSQTAFNAPRRLTKHLARFYRQPDNYPATVQSLKDFLGLGNQRICELRSRIESGDDARGCMGTVIWLNDKQLTIYQTGRTAAILLRPGVGTVPLLPQDKGESLAENFFGKGDDFHLGIACHDLCHRDILLLLSAGVTKVFSPEDAASCVMEKLRMNATLIEATAHLLKEAAKASADKDTLTVMMVKFAA